MKRDAASMAQLRAADPSGNVWLGANAGSGKTSVLTDRVARLLLKGVKPGSILCLTYTKAAATEMQNRLFERLGHWAMLADTPLAADLARLGLDDVQQAEDLNRARRLFAQAIETPGGLRIQTIHSFCAGLLRRFPMEAGISPAFTEIEERAAKLLQAEVLEDVTAGEGATAFAELAQQMGGDAQTFDLLAAILSKRESLGKDLDERTVLAALEAPTDLTPERLRKMVLRGDEQDWFPGLIALMARSGPKDQGTANDLARVDLERMAPDDYAALEKACLFGETAKAPFGAKVGQMPTKDLRNSLDISLRQSLEDLMLRVEAARPLRLALNLAQRSGVLYRFAALFLAEYNARKAARGALDFDDLIRKARDLLSSPGVAPWVLYRLDGGISHILVDEAQDTSPAQWQVIRLLADEILAGQGAADQDRTIFVVGDKKQSIYSFQGADALEFDRMRDLFSERLGSGGQRGLADLTLEYSFRSSPLILAAVDAALAGDATNAALGGAFRHQAYRGEMPGRIELWPPILPEETPKDEDWSNPVDLVPPEHHSVRMARRVADRITQMLGQGTMIPTKDGGQRPLRPGDILILVQKRSDLFSEILRALKQAGLPVAGADRMNLGAELAVRDLTALLAFLATPEDDLALAHALRSPLFGWSEDQLYNLAQGRKGFLWESLRQSGAENGSALTVLTDLRDQSDYMRPFDLIERMLTRHRGREKLLARLGIEAEDGIDALLAQTLAYERGEVPSLTGFLAWMQSDDVSIKRQLDSSQDLIRMMTVHGAKGLEAPVVFLPETADRRLQVRDMLVQLAGNGPLVWKPTAAESPDAVKQAMAEARDDAERESLRLLYVAMTRAQSWLIVGSAGALKSETSDVGEGASWYDRIKAGLMGIGATVTEDGGLSARFGDWPQPTGTSALNPVQTPDQVKPDLEPVAPPRPSARPLSPSDLGGVKVMPGDPANRADDGLAGKAFGTALHLLLEHLPKHPPDRWEAIAAALLAEKDQVAATLPTAQRLLTDPSLAPIFGPDSLAEVGVTALLDGQPILGSIDRLVLTGATVLAVDFKSNQIEPANPQEVPEGIRRQMRAYAAALEQIYPDRTVQTAVLWTGSGRLMTLD